MNNPPNRREFLMRLLALSAAGLAASACRPSQPGRPAPSPTAQALAPASPAPQSPVPAPQSSTAVPHLAVARGPGAEPGELVRRALAALGGIERFVRAGDDVVIKPNICNAYHGPEYASTTNPDVVAALVALCISAGAQRVRVMDYPFGGSAQACYTSSGIEEAVLRAGGAMEVMNRMRFRRTALPAGKAVREADVYGDVLDADVLINVPIAKDHGGARLTLAMKNLMGVIQDRGAFHARGLHQCIADLSSAVRPHLTLIDAIRILTDNGPTGGNLDDVKRTDTLIASTDAVAADSYAATLFGLQAKDIGYIRMAAEMGLGRSDLEGIRIEEIQVS